jgi:methyl-accepting chemotaxis protein
MKFRFTIANKIGIGFGLLMFFVLLTSSFSLITLRKNLRISREIENMYQPSAKSIDELSIMITESKMLIKNWVAERNEGTAYKMQLEKLHRTTYPELNKRINQLSVNWEKEDQQRLISIS